MRRSTVATSVKKQQIYHGIVVLAMRHLAAIAFALLFLCNLKAYFMPPSCISFSREDKNGGHTLQCLHAKETTMGSLMAGWSSPFQDPNHVKVQRNRSHTREEIDAFWKEKKSKEEYVGAVNCLVDSNQENINIGSSEMLRPSGDLPLRDGKQSILNSSSKSDADILKTNCWWTRSSYAFLNAIPVTSMEGPSYKYASQYPVSDLCFANRAAYTYY